MSKQIQNVKVQTKKWYVIQAYCPANETYEDIERHYVHSDYTEQEEEEVKQTALDTVEELKVNELLSEYRVILREEFEAIIE